MRWVHKAPRAIQKRTMQQHNAMSVPRAAVPKRKRSPRKLEPHEVLARLKARAAA